MNYYTFHSGDYLRDTSHLTLIEDAIYRRLIDWYYTKESPLPNDIKKISRLIRAVGDEDIVGVIVEEFFKLSENEWHQYRCDEEIAIYHGKAEKARENGKLGGRPKTKDKANHNPEETESVILDNLEESESKANQEPRTKNHKPITNNQSNTIGDFDVFWNQYPNKTAKQAAVKAWSKLKPNESLFNLIIDALEKQKPHFKVGFIPHPATWLNGRRWEDAIPTQAEGQEAKPTNQPKQPEFTPPVYKNWSDEPLPPADKKWGMTPEQLAGLRAIRGEK